MIRNKQALVFFQRDLYEALYMQNVSLDFAVIFLYIDIYMGHY